MFTITDYLYTLTTVIFNPLGLSLLLLIVILFIKNNFLIKLLVIGVIIILYISSTKFLTSNLLETLEKYQQVSDSQIKENKALILLGAGLDKKDDKITPSLIAYTRILETYRIYKAAKKHGIAYKIIITGGDVKKINISEAEVYGKVLEQLGVEKNDLILETKSLNTYKNAQYTKQITTKLPYSQYILVTSAIHMKRALLFFKHFGIKVIPSVSDTPRNVSSLIPSAYNLTLSSLAIHEYLGILRFYIYEYFNMNKSGIIFTKAGQ